MLSDSPGGGNEGNTVQAENHNPAMRANLLERLGDGFALFFRKTTPDPMVLAVLLTAVTFVLAWVVQEQSPGQIIAAWQGDAGFFSLLGFSMQMVLILVTGHALACAPVCQRMIAWLSAHARTPRKAVVLVSLTAMVCGLLNWGLGLIVGAMLARDVGRKLRENAIPHNYPLLVAAGYTGMLCWHGGLSGSAPLKMTLQEDVERFVGAEVAARVGELPFTETVLALPNLIVTGGLVLIVPLLLAMLHPKAGLQVPQDAQPDEKFRASDKTADATWAEQLEDSKVLAWLVVIALGAGVWNFASTRGIAQLDPNALNLIFLTLGLAAHGSLRAYVEVVGDGIRGTTGIVLQFPFYAGIMGIMRTTGLAATLAQGFTSSVNSTLFPLATFLSAAVVNLFVPSGGGQWAVQAPIAMQGATELGVSPALAMMSVAYGDELTNMLQPFWALPLLAITGTQAKDIIGYCALTMVVASLWMSTWLIVFAHTGW